ncbi:MAG TPA: hypothetical protein PKY22_00460, partial [Accumulibacter sp.]|nr:hypothetical protein [Accumulibacter sp.]
MAESFLLIVGLLLLLIVAIFSIRLFNVRRLTRKRTSGDNREQMLAEAAIEAKRLNEQRRKAVEELAISESETLIDTEEPATRRSNFAIVGTESGKTTTTPEAQPSALIDSESTRQEADAERKAAEDAARRDAERQAAEDA